MPHNSNCRSFIDIIKVKDEVSQDRKGESAVFYADQVYIGNENEKMVYTYTHLQFT